MRSENVILRLRALSWGIDFKVMQTLREEEDISEPGVVWKDFFSEK